MLIDFETVHRTYLKGSMDEAGWSFNPVNPAKPRTGRHLSTYQVFSNAGLGVALYLRNDFEAGRAIKVHVGLKLVFSRKVKCPWTKSCGGKFLTIDPDGSVFNCSEFSDLGDERYRFGNILTGEVQGSTPIEVKFYPPAEIVSALAASPASKEIMRRQIKFPVDCRSCDHFIECEGGCARDSVLFERGMGGKFGYCESWKMVFTRLKQSVASGEADKLLLKLGITPADAHARISDLSKVS